MAQAQVNKCHEFLMFLLEEICEVRIFVSFVMEMAGRSITVSVG